MRQLTPAILVLAGSCAFAQSLPQIEGAQPIEGAQQVESGQPSYGGPVILSRSPERRAGAGGELFRMRPFIELNGVYDTGLTGYSISPNGQIPDDSGYGGEAGFGVYGYHPWRRSLLGVDYRGSLRHYNRKTYYDGFDNFLAVRFTHQPLRHLVFDLNQSLASYSHVFFLPIAGSSFYDPNFSGLAQNDLFNNRTNVLYSTGSLVYQKTARLSFGAGGNGFVVKRRNPALIGVSGYGATGDVAYRLSRFQTIGLDYSYNHYGYKHFFGNTDYHGLAVNYSVQLSRRWTLGLRAGGYRVEVQSLQQVAIDPVIAAIVGQGFAISTFHNVVYFPNLAGNLVRRFRRAALSFDYSRSINPGNGVYLTSAAENATASYHYNGIRRMSIGFSGGYNSYSAITQTLSKYRNYTGGIGGSYVLRRNLSLTAHVDGRKYKIGPAFDRIFYRASFGLAFSPGEMPFSIW